MDKITKDDVKKIFYTDNFVLLRGDGWKEVEMNMQMEKAMTGKGLKVKI